ncbi:hypothetical protein, partial [Segatella copri]|uniref:hypothetical protein n=1 Tax=Segatella copri TaxID=165179 RepID=UPI001C906141
SDGKNTLLHVTWKRKIVTESRLAICQIRDNFAEKESRNPKDDTESKTSGFSKKKKYNRTSVRDNELYLNAL